MKAGDNKTGFDSMLRRGLSSDAAPTAQGCPDTDVLAAYYERAVAPAEIERFDAHLATCARCREQIAALVRSEPPDEKTKVAPAPSPWNWLWLAPAVAAIAIIVIWVGVREHNKATSEPTEVAITAAPRPQELALPSPPVSQRASPERSVTGDGLSKPAAVPTFEKKFSRASPQGLAKENAEGPSIPKGRASAGEAPSLTGAGGGMSSAGGIAGGAVTAPPPPEDSALSQTLAQPAPADAATPANRKATKIPAPQSPSSGAMTARNQLAMSAKIPATNAPAAAKSAAADQLQMREETSSPILIPSPDATKSWRIASGAIEFSSDSGVTWEMQRPGIAGALTAGYSPSAKICWIVGRGGAVLRTANGIDWIRVTAPTTEDLTAVSASSAKHAQVTAVGGTVFVTKDGGKSWTPRNNP